ncbi:MAG: glycosyl hydrolase [Parabacteroides sp.]|nr:glycosyl hydrolase [Parabacteroides sp.]
MKKQNRFKVLFSTLALGVTFCGLTGCVEKNTITNDSFEELNKGFVNPSSDYRTAPLAVWNSKVTNSEVERTMQELKDAGFGGLFVHPRPGLITEYMSDEWYSLFRHAVDFGKEKDMKVWIYDENSYPSGFAGGHVPQEMPESYNQGQGLALKKVDMLPENTDDYFICLKKDGDSWKDITGEISSYKDKKGEYYLYKKTFYGRSDWYGGYSYVDIMVKGVTEKFLELTMNGYEKVAGKDFGNTVPGIFSDEPNIASPGGLRWTPDLFAVFKEKWGYDLKPLLPLLEEETGNWKEVRHNYMETLLQLFIDRWSKPFNQYCEQNNMKWTGHYWEHGWPHMNDGPDNMAMYAWHQLPAIDMLFNQFDEKSPVAQFGNVRAVKELRSVANQMGYTRTLSETYGGGGWDETFKDFKRLGDWEYVLGVNYMNQHLAHMTLTGARKYDYPPVFTYHSPWWSSYKYLNDYYARLSLVMSKGVQDNDILVIEPNSTLWSYYSHTKSSPKLMEIGTEFQKFVTTLEKCQVEYDLGSENIIKDHGSVSNSQFVINKASYSLVVLPPMMETLNRPTFELMKEYVKQGGKVVCFSSPCLVDGVENKELSDLWNNENVLKINELNSAVMNKELSSKDCKFTFKGGNLYHHRRVFADGELLFLVNSSMDEAVSGNVSMKGNAVLELDAMTGKVYTYPSEKENNTLSADFKIEPAGSLLLYFSNKSQGDYPKKTSLADGIKLESEGAVLVKRMRENALNVDFCDLTVKGKTYKNIYFAEAANIAFKEYGFVNGNPWNTSVQYKRNILDRDTFKTGGFTVKYNFRINDKFDYSDIKLVAERPEYFTVSINGEKLSANPGEWWLDRSFGVYSVGNKLKQGVNTVEMSVSPMSIFAEIEPVYIIGDFSVVPEDKGWSISSPVEKLTLGSWKSQKQPFYSWDVSYSKDYNISNPEKHYAVKLNSWNGTVAEVYVNGEKAGIIASDPYMLDVTSYIKAGKNNIEVRVIGSHKNLLGPHYNNPAPGLASPWHWKNIKQQIPGNEYQMIDYGLMEEFDLRVY